MYFDDFGGMILRESSTQHAVSNQPFLGLSFYVCDQHVTRMLKCSNAKL